MDVGGRSGSIQSGESHDDDDTTAFAAALHAATNRAFMHRKALRCASFRVLIGFWPDGMVISIGIGAGVHGARNNGELRAGLAPRVVPWAEVSTLTQARMIEIVDELAAPVYAAIGLKPDAEDDGSHLVVLGRGPGQSVTVAGYTADEFGIPAVDITGGVDYLAGPMTPARADELADHLKRAARRARGDAPA